MVNRLVVVFVIASMAGVCLQAAAPVSLEDELFTAIEHHNTANLRSVLEKGIDINSVIDKENGNTPLMAAARYGDTAIMDMLLKTNPDNINAKHKTKGYTALMFAVKKNHNRPIIGLLIEANADPDAQNNDGETVLQLAAQVEGLIGRNTDILINARAKVENIALAVQCGDYKLVEELLRLEHDINLPNKKGATPLVCAIERGNLSLAELLLNNKADVNTQGKDGCTPLIVAAKRTTDGVKFVKMLLKAEPNININQADNDGKMPLVCAYECEYTKRDFSVVRELILAGADIKALGEDQSVDVLGALIIKSKGHEFSFDDVILKLLAAVVDKDRLNKEGKTLLIVAIEACNVKAMQLLLEARADVNKCDGTGCTPLIKAVKSNNVEVVQLLLEARADANKCDGTGCTPLIKAVKSNNVEVVQRLINAGAGKSVNATDNYKNKALDYICGLGCIEFNNDCSRDDRQKGLKIRDLLFNAGATEMSRLIVYGRPNDFDVDLDVGQEGDTDLIIAIKTGKPVDEVEGLCSDKSTIDASGKRGYSPLALAIEKNRSDYVLLLLKNGATFTDVDRNGCTVLMCAAEKGNVEIVRALIGVGADLNTKNKEGYTALDLVATAKGDHVEVADILLSIPNQSEAEIKEKNEDVFVCQNRALCIAIQAGNVSIARRLLAANKAIVNYNYHDRAPLWFAVFGNKSELITLLLDAGAEVDTRRQYGLYETALEAAVRIGKREVARLLIAAGANTGKIDAKALADLRVDRPDPLGPVDLLEDRPNPGDQALASPRPVVNSQSPLHQHSSLWSSLSSPTVVVSVVVATLLAAACVWHYKYFRVLVSKTRN